MLHLNDSKTPIGSNRDRHENIGEGEIGLDGFRGIVNHPAFAGIPGILEVPGFDGNGPDLRNVELLKGLQEPARRARARAPRRASPAMPRLIARRLARLWVYSGCAAPRRLGPRTAR